MTTAIQDFRAYLDEMVEIVNRYLARANEKDHSWTVVNWDTSDAAIERYKKWCDVHRYDPTNKYHFWHYWGIPRPTSGDVFRTGKEVTDQASLEVFGPRHISPEQLETHGFKLTVIGGRFAGMAGEYKDKIVVTDDLQSPVDRYQIEIKLEFETFEVCAEQSILFPVTEHPVRGEWHKYTDMVSRFAFSTRLHDLHPPFGHQFAGEITIGSNDWEGLRETLQALYAIKTRASSAIRNHEYVEKRIRRDFAKFPSKWKDRVSSGSSS